MELRFNPVKVGSVAEPEVSLQPAFEEASADSAGPASWLNKKSLCSVLAPMGDFNSVWSPSLVLWEASAAASNWIAGEALFAAAGGSLVAAANIFSGFGVGLGVVGLGSAAAQAARLGLDCDSLQSPKPSLPPPSIFLLDYHVQNDGMADRAPGAEHS